MISFNFNNRFLLFLLYTLNLFYIQIQVFIMIQLSIQIFIMNPDISRQS